MTKSPNRVIGLIFGALYIVIGLVGFTATTGVGFFATTGGLLLGLFEVNLAHNLAHLVFGAALFVAALAGPKLSALVNAGAGAVLPAARARRAVPGRQPVQLLRAQRGRQRAALRTAAVLLAVGLGALKPEPKPAALTMTSVALPPGGFMSPIVHRWVASAPLPARRSTSRSHSGHSGSPNQPGPRSPRVGDPLLARPARALLGRPRRERGRRLHVRPHGRARARARTTSRSSRSTASSTRRSRARPSGCAATPSPPSSSATSSPGCPRSRPTSSSSSVPTGATQIAPLPTTQRYVDRINAGRRDLGGRLRRPPLHPLPRRPLRRACSSAASWPRRFGFETNGIGFYLFDDIADPRAFKDVYREQLDAAPWDAAERERVIDEVLLGLPLQHRALRRPRPDARRPPER